MNDGPEQKPPERVADSSKSDGSNHTVGILGRRVSRRQLMSGARLGAEIVGGAAIMGVVGKLERDKLAKRDDSISYKNLDETKVGPELLVRDFQGVDAFKNLEKTEVWTDNTILAAFNKSVGESLASGRQVEIDLPEGEIEVNKRLDIAIPEGAKILLKGHPNGSRLKLNPALSDVPKAWGSFGKQNMMYFKDMDGELVFDGIEFHGGSDRAGKEGYIPPASPWDSVVFVVGSGDGSNSDQHAVMKQSGKRKGRVDVKNCNFQNSESGGFMAQNVGTVVAVNLQGKNLDALFNASWCDKVGVTGLVGERLNSDGLYITNAQNVIIDNSQVKTARQAFDLQGNSVAHIKDSQAFDCATAYDVTKSETDGTVAGALFIENSDSSECQTAYAFGGVEKIAVKDSKSYMGGAWEKQYAQEEFLHGKGIVNADEALGYQPFAFYDLAGEKPDHVKFSDVKLYFSKDYSGANWLPDLGGVSYSKGD